MPPFPSLTTVWTTPTHDHFCLLPCDMTLQVYPWLILGLSGFFLHRLCRTCYTTSRTISIKSSFPLRTASPNWPLGFLFYMLTSQQLPHHPWLLSETTCLNPLDNRFLLTTSSFSVVTRLRTPWPTWWWFLSIGPLDLRCTSTHLITAAVTSSPFS